MTKPQWLIDKLATMAPEERAEYEREWLELQQAHEDCITLDALGRLNDLIRDRVIQAVERYQTSTYIVGRPGTGKTHVIKETLASLGADVGWKYSQGYVSPTALFELFRDHPDSVIVIDDVPELFKKPQAKQILMAALGGDPSQPRKITYSTKGNPTVVEFRGSLIAISNLPLQSDPLAKAIESRSVVLVHEPTDEMMVAMIRQLARKGYKGLSPDECQEVTEFVVTESKAGDYRMDLRAYSKALEDYLYCKSGAAYSTWQALVRSSLQRFARVNAGLQQYTRAGETEAERKIAAELAAKYPNPTPAQTAERNREWRERTGKAPDAYYRRLRELKG